MASLGGCLGGSTQGPCWVAGPSKLPSGNQRGKSSGAIRMLGTWFIHGGSWVHCGIKLDGGGLSLWLGSTY